MFGNPSTPGFTQLAGLDGNADGKIDALDSGLADFNGDGVVDAADTFDTLKVWVDENEDGKTDAGELKSLAELDIVSVSVTAAATNTVDSGNLITGTATFERGDGTTGTVAEVQLDTDDSNTTWLGDSSVSAEAATRPNLKGFGTLADLHVAMTLTPDLIDAVDAGLPSLDTIELDGLRDAARPILYAWASCDAQQNAIDRPSRRKRVYRRRSMQRARNSWPNSSKSTRVRVRHELQRILGRSSYQLQIVKNKSHNLRLLVRRRST